MVRSSLDIKVCRALRPLVFPSPAAASSSCEMLPFGVDFRNGDGREQVLRRVATRTTREPAEARVRR